ncbi:SusC/RagA family TonB-linked outer membrane protein [Chitinophaga caeni]|uniref:SusC/RagA family TonB-linked outer membrane protein n=1 Tax=Chitinophaga caeni TaxID=2029983 RepID=A0A291QSQ0_9BACT|nr:TonB-dependent receptor [Chitinophaga caeni]ATL46965.1 SusC/RagA family TonB-linked outer membrane protein [Chitinophaga caeni]
MINSQPKNMFYKTSSLLLYFRTRINIQSRFSWTVFVCLLVTLCLQVRGNALSQQVSMSGKNLSFKQIFSKVEKQTGYVFFYNADVLQKTTPVDVSVTNMPIETFLTMIMKDQPVDFEINAKTITIKEKIIAKTGAVKSSEPVRQDPPIKGKVYDNEGNPLPGATVSIVGTNTGVQTNEQGEFSIQAKKTDVLAISYLGFERKLIPLATTKLPISVTLMPSKKNIDEVVVIGYGTVKKSDLTGSVTSVRVKDIENVPVTRVDQMLQGRIAGADIVSTDGEPGAATTIRIRGTRSISASNEPLFIVDGLMDAITSLNEINPSDIASIDVLKDASSTAIYGSRGSNGVIIITTKSGSDKLGKTNFTFRNDAGFSELPRYLDLMNATEFAQLQNDRYYFASTANQTKPLEDYPYPDPLSLGEGTNWTREITRRAPYQNTMLSASGGDKTTQYYFSANYNNNQGIIQNSGLKRYQVRLNLDRNISKFVKAGLRLNYSRINRNINTADIGTNTLWYRSTIFLAPTMPAYKEDGSFNDWNTQWYSGTLFDSPVANVNLKKNKHLERSLSSMMYLEVKPIKNVVVKSTLSYADYNRDEEQFQPSTLPTRAHAQSGAYAYRRAYAVNNYLNENTVTYRNKWNNVHQFDAMYGFTVQKKVYKNMAASGNGYFVDDIESNDLGALPSKDNISLSSYLEEQGRVSHLARLNYNYAGKYYLTITSRLDGASNFAANNKWALFPSAAFRWNAHREPFMKNARSVDELAFRLSGGTSGNDAIARYQSLARLSSTTGGYLFDGSQPVAYYPGRVANEGLTWEKTTTYNAGVDLSLFKRRLEITVDAYKSMTSDLLLTVQLPSQVGFTSRWANIGKTSNKGIELTVTHDNIRTKNFNWSTTITAAHNKQLVEDIGGLDRVSVYDNPYGAQYMMYGYVKGQPLNALWGMEYAGVWKSKEEIEQNEKDKKYASAAVSYYSPGRQRYIDQNHDGILDNNDLVYLGNADPDVYGGIQNRFSYKKFSLSFYFNYNIGGKIYNPVELFMGNGTYLTNQFRYMVNAWHPVRNPNSDYPRADSKDDIPNDRFVHDATYLRLKNITVSYPIDLAKLTHQKLKTLALTLSGNNLYLWKDYNGYDPEVSTKSDGSTIRRMDNGAYPASRTITFSAELKF